MNFQRCPSLPCRRNRCPRLLTKAIFSWYKRIMEKKDDSKIENKNGENKPSDQTTIISEREHIVNYEETLTLRKEDEQTHDKTIAVFNLEDITGKLQAEIDDIPEADMDEIRLAVKIKEVIRGMGAGFCRAYS